MSTEIKHKLDVLLEDISKISKDYMVNIKIMAEYNLRCDSLGSYRAAIRIDIDAVTLYYQTYEFHSQPTSDQIDKTKDYFYDNLIRYIVLTRLPIWKESIEIMKNGNKMD